MGRICRDPTGQWFFWKAYFPPTTQALLASSNNPRGDISINDLNMCIYLAHISLFCPCMSPLAHILSQFNNTAVMGGTKRSIVSTATTVGPLLRYISLLSINSHVHSPIYHISGEDNCMSYSAYCLTHITYRFFLAHFRIQFLHLM